MDFTLGDTVSIRQKVDSIIIEKDFIPYSGIFMEYAEYYNRHFSSAIYVNSYIG